MRVIAGSAGGVPLRVPPGLRVRPTSGRVRTSLFSILGEAVVGARVADLFAGCGALGIEALSRGAAFCCFVENARPALAALQANLAKTRFAAKADILACDAFSAVPHLASRGPFDLILLDPPYRLLSESHGGFVSLLDDIAGGAALAPSSTVVVQHDTQAPLPESTGRLQVGDRRLYGTTALTFLGLRPPGPGGTRFSS
ncbi:MAG TPA: 16S rRNA (guanine(966)-N(2))-methyltransferase RsmD [Planctomycetota bacterium]|nr:16S rRNA (guanine(966)-N(2))-methyltransferase RsmD [Planctomycetota bacterium]